MVNLGGKEADEQVKPSRETDDRVSCLSRIHKITTQQHLHELPLLYRAEIRMEGR